MQQPVGAPARRRLSARQTLQRLIVRSIDIEQRLCAAPQKAPQFAEGKKRAELKLVGEGQYARVYSLGTAIAVKRIVKPSQSLYLSDLEQSPLLLQAYQQIVDDYSQQPETKGLLTTEEFVSALAGQYGIAPYLYRVAVCPVTGYRLLFMEQWDRTLETDMAVACCADPFKRQPLLPWLEQPLRIWRDLSLKVMKLNGLGIVHGDVHDRNVVVRRDPFSGQVQIALIDFGRAGVDLHGMLRQRLQHYSVVFTKMFAEWERLGWLDTPLTNTDVMKAAVQQYTKPIVYNDLDMYFLQRILKDWWYYTVKDIIACAAEVPSVAIAAADVRRPPKRRLSSTAVNAVAVAPRA